MAILNRTPHPLGRAAGRRLGIPGASILAAGFIAAAALLPVVQSSSTTSTGHEIGALETRRADLAASIHRTQAEIARMGALERVEGRARELGMTPADRWMYVEAAPPPAAGMPARYLNEESPSAQPARDPWWRSLARRLPLP